MLAYTVELMEEAKNFFQPVEALGTGLTLPNLESFTPISALGHICSQHGLPAHQDPKPPYP